MKAVNATTASVAAQTLTGTQLRRFLRLVIGEVVGLNDSTIYDVEGPTLALPNIDIEDGQYAVGLGGSQRIPAADEITPTFDQRVLSPVAFDFRIEIEQTQLKRWNIERDQIQTTIDELLATYMRNVLEDEYWNAQAGGAGRAGYGTGALTVFNGWRAVAMNAAHTIDFGGAPMSTHILREMFLSMPTKWRNQGEVYYTASDVVVYWHQYLERVRATSMGDLAIGSDETPRYLGMPILGVPKIRIDEAGLNALSGSTLGYTWALLTLPSNKAIGFNPALNTYLGTRDDGKVQFLNAWGQSDADFENVDRVVLGYNIRPQAAVSQV